MKVENLHQSLRKKNLTKSLKIIYKNYFVCKINDQDKTWEPHTSCKNCYTGLAQWLNGKQKSMPFAVPMIWREPANQKVSEYSKRTKSRIVHPDCPSALRPVPHSHENIPIPTPPSVSQRDNDSSLAESIDFSQTLKSSAIISLMFSDKEPHSL